MRPACSTTNSRAVSPGAAPRKTGLEKLPTRDSVGTPGGGGGGLSRNLLQAVTRNRHGIKTRIGLRLPSSEDDLNAFLSEPAEEPRFDARAQRHHTIRLLLMQNLGISMQCRQ